MTWWEAEPPVETLVGERWAPAPDCPRLYSVSTAGRAYSWIRDRLLTPKPNSNGVMQVTMRGKSYLLAHQVLEAFGVPKSSPSDFVGYKNGDPTDCSVANLEWKSRADLQRAVNLRRPRKPRKPKPLRVAYDAEMLGEQ